MLVRHPFAVVTSMLHHGAWDYSFKKFEIPEGPFNDFYQQHEPFLYSLKTKEEQLTALWCMTNNVVLRHPQNNQSWITVNYENMVLDPMQHFQMIFKKWNLEIPKELSARILTPSATTVGKQKIVPEQLLSDWKNKLSAEQVNRLQKVLDYFEVDYYGDDIMPLFPANGVHLKIARQ